MVMTLAYSLMHTNILHIACCGSGHACEHVDVGNGNVDWHIFQSLSEHYQGVHSECTVVTHRLCLLHTSCHLEVKVLLAI